MFEELNIPSNLWNTIRQEKKRVLCGLNKKIDFIKGAPEFIKMLSDLGIKMVVVTNTNKEFVDVVRNSSEVFKCIDTWITREDYVKAKPDNECYKKAVDIYNGKKYIIGFENTYNGFKAFEGVTTRTYCITDKNSYSYKLLKSEDTILIKDYSHFLEKL
jgi:beta-phosphoglucomutase-like phosphatase (HAD superfamily)